MADSDLIVVGGGIVGLATAVRLTESFPDLSVRLLEKESGLARHQTGNNSGVVHAGVYYEPGSLKARFCRSGSEAMAAFCKAHELPYDRCGKLIVASDDTETERLKNLFERCKRNGLTPSWIDESALSSLEENIVGRAAVLVPTSAITDYKAITDTLASQFLAAGGVIERNSQVVGIEENRCAVDVETGGGVYRTSRLIACAGLMADRLAEMCGVDLDFRIVPFRGEYFRLPESKRNIVRHLIYPVPDPSLPFLGIHLTRTVGGGVTVGPNAVLALAREGYSWRDVSPKDIAEMAAFPGTWKLLRKHWRSALSELRNSVFRRQYLDQCRKYCPSLELDDLQPHPAGVRAQAVLRDGTLVHDFLIRRTRRTMHVCNAPSPAATSAMSIAEYLVDEASRAFELRGENRAATALLPS